MYRYCCCHYGGRISNEFLYVEKNTCKKDVTNNYVTQIIDFVFFKLQYIVLCFFFLNYLSEEG